MAIVMGTAGHIDHGKTTLIKALTGINCDRLVEEKKRGITIELGFAYLDLDPKTRISIIDVPGHEKFVKNMVAGAAGIDFVLLVIAADEGIMPQTKEHLEICSLLGIKYGLVVLTKIDLVDPEWLELVQEDVKTYLQSTFLENAPLIPVSAHTGQGLEDLKRAIASQVKKAIKIRDFDLFRLPIDRVFSIKGHGTVVTGTTVSGKIKVGEEVCLYPKKEHAKIRSLQVHTQDKEVAQAGERTALNLQGIDKDKIERGDIVARPNTLFPDLTWTVRLFYLSSAPRPLKHRTEVHFHHGSKEVLARIYFLEKDEVKPGEQVLAQVRFPEPMVGVFGDRFVIRSFSPLRTIGGGIILDPMAPHLKRRSPDLAYFDQIEKLEPQDLILNNLHRAKTKGLNFTELVVKTGLKTQVLDKELQKLASQGKIFLFEREQKRYLIKEVFLELAEDLMKFIQNFHQKNPLTQGITKSELLSSWGKEYPEKLVETLLSYLQKNQKIKNIKAIISLFSHQVSLGQENQKKIEQLYKLIAEAKMTPPMVKEIIKVTGWNDKQVYELLGLLVKEQKLVQVNENFYLSAQSFLELKTKLKDYFSQNRDLTPKDFKTLTGLSRKYSIPLLEFLDKAKITMRVGDKRVLRKKID